MAAATVSPGGVVEDDGFAVGLQVDSDVVVTMGCGDACPFFPGKRYEDWELNDPAGQQLEAVRTIREEIKHRVENLIASLAP